MLKHVIEKIKALRGLGDLMRSAVFIRFIGVGISNTLLCLVAFDSLLEQGWHHVLALILVQGLSIIYSYSLNSLWTFERSRNHSALSYILFYALSGLVNALCLGGLVRYAGADAFWGQCVLIPIFVIINFCSLKFWIFNKT